MSRRVYLAGPEVFLADFGKPIFDAKKRICERHGLAGVSPMDGELDVARLAPFEQGIAIYRGNVQHMRSSDAVIANMTPFRGVGMDGGTAFEMGYMRALDRPVLGYSNVVRPFSERSERYYALGHHLGVDPYTAGTSIERFGMADNLMMAGAVDESGFQIICTEVAAGHELDDLTGFEQCCDMLAGWWSEERGR
ncbi:MAG: nucleoside 2-deoxyribosyltransferase [Hyphomicrobium sp.]|jgi:nucleoside 2-deoxyribosyltransferase